MKKQIYLLSFLTLFSFYTSAQRDYTKYVMLGIGIQSEFALSNGNLYPATALPGGMNHWSSQTASKNEERWFHSYNSHYITEIRQTHQPSTWTGDYVFFRYLLPSLRKNFPKTTAKVGSHTKLKLPYLMIIKFI